MTSSESSDPTTAWSGPLHSSRRIGADERPSTAVVLALAAATNAEPTELTPPLHSFVDPEAIDALLDRGRDALRIEFDAYGCRVTVEGDAVEVRPRDGIEGVTDGV